MNQTNQLIGCVNRVAEHSPFYQKIFADHGIDPRDVRNIEDFENLPFI